MCLSRPTPLHSLPQTEVWASTANFLGPLCAEVPSPLAGQLSARAVLTQQLWALGRSPYGDGHDPGF